MTTTPNGHAWLKHPLIVALIVGLVGAIGWQAVTEYRQTRVEADVREHKELGAHPETDRRLTVLETRFGYIQRELREIKALLQRRAEVPDN